LNTVNTTVTPEQLIELLAGKPLPVKRTVVTRGNWFKELMIADALERGFIFIEVLEEGEINFTDGFKQRYMKNSVQST